MDKSKPRMGKKLRLIIVLAVAALIVLCIAWWYIASRTDRNFAGGNIKLSEQALLSMNGGEDIRTKEAATAAYEEQLGKKNSIKTAERGEKILYYSYLVSTAIQAGKCSDAEAAAKELMDTDITSAFTQMLGVARCYTLAGSDEESARLKEYVKANLAKLPENERPNFEGSLE